MTIYYIINVYYSYKQNIPFHHQSRNHYLIPSTSLNISFVTLVGDYYDNERKKKTLSSHVVLCAMTTTKNVYNSRFKAT